MFLIIAGGGRIGYNLLKSQLSKDNEVVVIESSKTRCSNISEEFGNLVINGDACDPSIMEAAGIKRAEIMIACTGKDQDNLVICQIARKKFHLPYTVALVNNPHNEEVFKNLGVDATVSSIGVVLNRIEQQIAMHGTMTVLAREGNTEIIETKLPQDSPAVSKTIRQIPFFPGCHIVALIREEEYIPVDADLALKEGDILITLSPRSEFSHLKTSLLGFEISSQER